MAFPNYGIVDDGSRTENPLSNAGFWSNATPTNMKEGAGVIQADTAAPAFALSASNTTSADCEMRCIIRAHPNTTLNNVELHLRYNDGFGAGSSYRMIWKYLGGTPAGTYDVTINKLIAGANTQLAFASGFSIALGDQIGCDVIGDTLTMYTNTTSILSVAGGSTVTAAGVILLLVFDNTFQCDDIGAGPFVVVPTVDTYVGAWSMQSPQLVHPLPRMRASGSGQNPRRS